MGRARPAASSPRASAPAATATPAEVPAPCVVAQADPGVAGVSATVPVLDLVDGLPGAEDLYVDGDRLLIGQYTTGRISVLWDQPAVHQLPGTVPEVEGITRLGGTLYVGDQSHDRVVALADDGGVRTVLQLNPVPGVEGLDSIANDGRFLLVPDSARGVLLWVSPDGAIQRSAAGFQRPTGAWPGPDGSVLVAEENGGRVWSVAAGGGRSLLAGGLGLDDDVVRSEGGRIYSIAITGGRLVEVLDGGRVRDLLDGLAQPQGLALDHADNPIVTEYDRGRVLLAVESFAVNPGRGVAALAARQPLCVRLVRGGGFTDAVTIEPGPGYRVIAQPGAGTEGAVLPEACAQPPCAVRVRAGAGGRYSTTWLQYTTG